MYDSKKPTDSIGCFWQPTITRSGRKLMKGLLDEEWLKRIKDSKNPDRKIIAWINEEVLDDPSTKKPYIVIKEAKEQTQP